MRFSRLELVRQVSSGSRQTWLCKCVCGNTVEVRADKLGDGRKKSCGCIKAEIAEVSKAKRLKLQSLRSEVLERRLRTRREAVITPYAEKHRLLKTLLQAMNVPGTDPLWSLDFYSHLIWDDECHYCGGPLLGLSVSLDWKFGGSLYVANNAVPCCPKCRELRLMHSFTFEEMEILSPALELVRLNRRANNV